MPIYFLFIGKYLFPKEDALMRNMTLGHFRMYLQTFKYLLTILFLGAVLLVFLPPGASAKTDKDAISQKAQAALQKSVRSLELQTKLPVYQKKEPAKNEGVVKDEDVILRNKTIPDKVDEPKRYVRDIKRSSAWEVPQGLAKVLLWGSILAIVVIIFIALSKHLRHPDRSKGLSINNSTESDLNESVGRMHKVQFAADELAGLGNFTEAIHVLLLQSVSELRRQLELSIAESLTSREILHYVELPPNGRTAFADIIERVEIFYFGRSSPGKEEYLACRHNFVLLTKSLQEKTINEK